MGDLTSRRGKVQGVDPDSGRTRVKTLVPEAELYKYTAKRRSIIQCRAHHSRTLAGYEPAPDHIAENVRIERQGERAH